VFEQCQLFAGEDWPGTVLQPCIQRK
jgi:hypothetical protein